MKLKEIKDQNEQKLEIAQQRERKRKLETEHTKQLAEEYKIRKAGERAIKEEEELLKEKILIEERNKKDEWMKEKESRKHTERERKRKIKEQESQHKQ